MSERKRLGQRNVHGAAEKSSVMASVQMVQTILMFSQSAGWCIKVAGYFPAHSRFKSVSKFLCVI